MNPVELEDRLRRQEDRNFDFKVAGEFGGEFRGALTVDIAAMANTSGGGTVVIGVRKVDGAWAAEGISPAQLASFDTTPVAQFVGNFLDPLPRFTIETVEVGGKTFLAIAVVEFEDVPIIVKKTLQHVERVFAKEGDIFIRSEAAQTRRVQSADEMRQLLGRALSRKSENLLADIRAVVTGLGPRQLEMTPDTLFGEQLPFWSGEVATFDKKFEAFARWEVRILIFPLASPLDPKMLPDVLHNAQVSLRGWNFPHIDGRTGPLFGLDFVEVRTDWREHQELAFLGVRGAFGFAKVEWSDLRKGEGVVDYAEPPERILDAIGILWSLTECFRFTLNLAEGYRAESVWLSVRLKGIRGRSLGSFDPGRMWWGDRQSRTAEVPLEGLFTVADLKSSWKVKARDWAKRIFTVFQSPDLDDGMLSKDQDQLIDRR